MHHYIFHCFWSSCSQSVAPGSKALALPGSLLKIQILGPHARPAESENLGGERGEAAIHVLTSPLDHLIHTQV